MVEAVTASSETVTALRNFSGIESWPGKTPVEEVSAAAVFVADRGPLVFILTAILTVGITVLTVSFQAVKAAMVNPVRSLKTE